MVKSTTQIKMDFNEVLYSVMAALITNPVFNLQYDITGLVFYTVPQHTLYVRAGV